MSRRTSSAKRGRASRRIWIESRIAEHPEACCTMGDGKNCRILIRADFFLALLDKECEQHAAKVAAERGAK